MSKEGTAEVKVMTSEIAKNDLNAWLDAKRIKSKDREAKADQIEQLLEAMEDGALVLDPETNNLIYTLNFEVAGKKVLTFKPRVTVSELNDKLRGVDGTKPNEMLVAYIAATTELSLGIIKKIDLSDYKIGQAVCMFFL